MQTRYRVHALQSQAPQITNCITAVRFLVQEITQTSFPLVYIGDMPKFFLEQGILGAQVAPLVQAREGDLVFFYGTSRFQVPMVRHVGMIVDEKGNFFHSVFTKKDVPAGRIQNVFSEKIFQKVATLHQVLTSKDPRGS